MDSWDNVLSKLASVAFILFLITIRPAAMNFVKSVNPWIFLLASIILNIGISFSAGWAEWGCLRPFSLVPSFGMINHNMMGYQVDLKIAEAGLKTTKKLKKRRKSPGPLLQWKDKIIKNIRPRSRRNIFDHHIEVILSRSGSLWSFGRPWSLSRRCSGEKPLCLVSSSCLTSIIGREYNFFVRGSMLLGFREQRSQAIAKSKILSLKIGYNFRQLSDVF